MSGFFFTYSITLSSVLSVLTSRTLSLFPLFTARKIPILNVLLDAYMSQHRFGLAQDVVYFLNHSALNRNECSLGPHHAGSAFPYHQEVPLNFELAQRSVSLHTDTVRMLLIIIDYSHHKHCSGQWPANDLPIHSVPWVSRRWGRLILA